MRRPLRKAVLWFGLALAGAAMAGLALPLGTAEGGAAAAVAGIASALLIPFGVVYGVLSLLSALGEARLRRGAGVLARWQLPAREWEAFRLFDARRGKADPRLLNDYTPGAAEGRSVEVLFGQRQVIVDGSYHPLRRWAVPELRGVGWLQPEGAPECLEFTIAYPRGRHGGVVTLALRVPVARAARDDAVRVFRHFQARAPVPREGLAYRRPGLVIGWGIGLTAAALATAGIGWLLERAGERGDLPILLQLVGLIAAIGAAIFTLIIVLATMPWRRRDR